MVNSIQLLAYMGAFDLFMPPNAEDFFAFLLNLGEFSWIPEDKVMEVEETCLGWLYEAIPKSDSDPDLAKIEQDSEHDLEKKKGGKLNGDKESEAES